MRRDEPIARNLPSEVDEQEFQALLTDCALPADVSRVFTDYLTLGPVGASEAYVVVHKALFGRR